VIRTFYITVALALLAAVALVAGNNLSACVGTTIGSGILGRKSGTALGIAGYILGLLIQGSYLERAAAKLLPFPTPAIVTEALAVTVVVFLIGHFLKAPLSLTMSLVGLMAGISYAHHQFIHLNYFGDVAAMWIIAPILAIASAFILTRLVNNSDPKDIWNRVALYKIMLIAASFLASYVLGANTIGLMVSVAGYNLQNLVVAMAAIIIGAILLSSRELRRVGHELFSLRYSNALITLANSILLVELATLFGIPLSNTQTLSAGLFGSGLSYRQRYISMKPFAIIVLGWIIAPAASFIAGYLI
jgi:PiT family inorganic phosphate transporter